MEGAPQPYRGFGGDVARGSVSKGLCRGSEARERMNHIPLGMWGDRRPEDLKGERKQRRRGVGEPNSRYGRRLNTLRGTVTS